jgi:CubicO group peptidase (beta-lactamase class C family)
MKSLVRILAVLMILSLSVACASPGGTAPVAREPDYWPTEGWRSSTPEAQGMDSEQLARMFEYIEEKDINLHSLLIVRNGYLVTEAYLPPYDQATYHQMASVTKSVIGILVGMAIDRGYIKSVNEPVMSFFAGRTIANLDARKRAIMLQHLLSLTSGLSCMDKLGSDQEVQQSKDWVQFMLDLPMSDTPGTRFSYCTGAVHLLSAVLQGATGMTMRDFANEQLFKPLGIAPVPSTRWGSDPQGITTGGFGLQLQPRDMAKLGYLYLNSGAWAGRQIVPSDWVIVSVTKHSVWQEQNRAYGYLWWLYPAQGYYSAMGMGGQQIHIVPKLNLVVVFTSALNPRAEDYLDNLLNDYIMPSVKANSALPANPGAAARLLSHIQKIQPSRQAVPPLPETALRVAGKTYTLESNSMSWQKLSLVFCEGSDAASLIVDSSGTVAIGLDNVFRVTEIPGLGPTAMRGHWEDADTFVIQSTSVGNPVESRLVMTFTGDEISVTLEDMVFGGMKVNVHGTS